MEINPFLAPLISALHGLPEAKLLAQFLAAGHFSIGHATGFGKLVDEKILPNVFGAVKLDKKTRVENGWTESCFDNVDHWVKRPNGTGDFLSLKASKWTIQLGQAVDLNRSFNRMCELKKEGTLNFEKIVVGVYYGHQSSLTDKYDLVRGINRGADHELFELSEEVDVLCGSKFWDWLGSGSGIQTEVMMGILEAIELEKISLDSAGTATDEYSGIVAERIGGYGSFDPKYWLDLLGRVNHSN